LLEPLPPYPTTPQPHPLFIIDSASTTLAAHLMPLPNILWICTDSQRWDTLGCTGNSFVHTPNLNRLAQSGILFDHAFATSPLSMPSRGNFLTGRYPSTTRLRQNGQEGIPDLRPVTRTFARAGYHCGLIGKLHLANCDRRLALGPEWWKQPQDTWAVPVERRGDDGYATFLWDHVPSGTNPNSAYTQWLIAHGVNPIDQPQPHPDCPHVHLGRPKELHPTTWCASEAARFIRERSQDRSPWLLSVNIYDPHPSFNPPESSLHRYLDHLDDIPLPTFQPSQLDTAPDHHRRAYHGDPSHSTRDWHPRDLRLVRAAYWAMCDLIDEQIGRILFALDAAGQRDRTLVIFSSDHGQLLGDHGILGKGPFLFDPCLRVPLILSWPGRIRSGIRATGLVELTDLAPTLLHASGLPPDPSMQGRSLWPILSGQAPADQIRDDVYAEYANADVDQPPQWLNMIRTPTHKLIAVHASLEGELYDLKHDPAETRNLWDDPTHLPLKINLLQRLTARMAFTADPLPRRLGIF
ncbi:MAG: sulfatase-like hydrolase/transferase, partial [Verrucomicrobiia bacterium]